MNTTGSGLDGAVDTPSTDGTVGRAASAPLGVEGPVAQPAQVRSKARAKHPGIKTLERDFVLMISFPCPWCRYVHVRGLPRPLPRLEGPLSISPHPPDESRGCSWRNLPHPLFGVHAKQNPGARLRPFLALRFDKGSWSIAEVGPQEAVSIFHSNSSVSSPV